ncbi:MAG: S26 family signal peptidase [Caldilineales bacterium]|nr:S26 family signal peptidase [Caldilineales bacterium]MDW8318281.1 S26 family signal peptidase [Anaerolineae bacterium]
MSDPLADQRSAAEVLAAVPPEVLLSLLREGLDREGRFRWRLFGASMWPTLPPGCEVEIVPLPAEGPKVGDVVVFLDRNTLIAHRLVRRDGALWIAQGDGRLGPDPPLREDQLVGRLAAAWQDGRPVWPRRAENIRATAWVARHHLLRPVRFVYRRLQGLRLKRR